MKFKSVEGNLRDSFRILASHHPSGEVREVAGVTIASVGVAFQMFNGAFLSAPVSSDVELERRITQAAVHFGARGLRWAFWLCEGWLAEKTSRRARQIFRKHHLTLSVELPGMLAEGLLAPVRSLPHLEIRRVDSEPARAAFCAIGASCFNVPLLWFREVFENETVWKEFAGYVGYRDSEPVSTAATVLGSGVVGVYNVATLPGCQRQGYGEAIMRYALEKAQQEHGTTRTILQSTQQGLRLYERMGYRTVTQVAVYTS